MKKLIISLIFSLIAVASYASVAIDPLDVGVGARPLGMGKAFTSIAGDASSIFFNPAGLNQVKGLQFLTMSGQLTDYPYIVAGVTRKYSSGTVGFGYSGYNIGGIVETTLSGLTPEVTGSQVSYNNAVVSLCYANEAKNLFFLRGFTNNFFEQANVGARLKLISQTYSTDTDFSAGNLSGYELDLGYYKKINQLINSGILIKNLLPGNNLGPDELPVVISAGITKQIPDRNMLLAFDINYTQSLILFHLGSEVKLARGNLTLRTGLDQKQAFHGISNNITFGVGLKIPGGFACDYAYHTYAELPAATAHFFSISLFEGI